MATETNVFMCGHAEEDIMKFDIREVSDDLLDDVEDMHN